MSAYVLMGNWTSQGAENLRNHAKPLNLIQEIFASMQLPLKEIYLVSGEYDVIVACEAPDEAVLERAVHALHEGDSVRVETLRVCTEQEYRTRIAQWR